MDHRNTLPFEASGTDARSTHPARARKRRSPLLGLAGLGLLAGMLALSAPATASRYSPAMAAPAKGFAFSGMRGEQVRLSDYRGKWVLVNFWAPWCPICRAEVPHLNQLDRRDDVSVVGIAMDYGPDQRDALEMARSMAFVNVLGGNRRELDNASTQVGPVQLYPMSYLYNPQGERVAQLFGPVTEDRVRRAMESADQVH
ncbi:MAG: TlpA disulfide reductase family protein [Pseudomonadota bacterium]